MPKRKHTRCSQCGSTLFCRYLEVMWRLASSGPWHYVGGFFCVADRHAFIGFIEGIGAEQLVGD